MGESIKPNMHALQEALYAMKESSMLKSVDIENLKKFLESSFCPTPHHESGKADPDFLKNNKIDKTKLSGFFLDESVHPGNLNQRIHDSLVVMQQLLSPMKNIKRSLVEENSKFRDSVINHNLNEATMGLKNSREDETRFLKELDKILQDLDISSDTDSTEFKEGREEGLENQGEENLKNFLTHIKPQEKILIENSNLDIDGNKTTLENPISAQQDNKIGRAHV